MSITLVFIAIGLPALALGLSAGALVLTKKSHERYREAILSEQGPRSEARLTR